MDKDEKALSALLDDIGKAIDNAENADIDVIINAFICHVTILLVAAKDSNQISDLNEAREFLDSFKSHVLNHLSEQGWE